MTGLQFGRIQQVCYDFSHIKSMYPSFVAVRRNLLDTEIEVMHNILTRERCTSEKNIIGTIEPPMYSYSMYTLQTTCGFLQTLSVETGLSSEQPSS
jgi:hypothetical protein